MLQGGFLAHTDSRLVSSPYQAEFLTHTRMVSSPYYASF